MIRLEDVLKTSWKRLEDVLKTSWRRLKDIWPRQIYWSWPRRLEDVLKTSSEDVRLRRTYSSWSRRLEDVFKTSSEDEDERCLQVFKTSSRRLHQDECLLSFHKSCSILYRNTWLGNTYPNFCYLAYILNVMSRGFNRAENCIAWYMVEYAKQVKYENSQHCCEYLIPINLNSKFFQTSKMTFCQQVVTGFKCELTRLPNI